MDASLVSYQARLATFQTTVSAKLRRTSSRSKKAAPKSKVTWPLSSPSAEDLAFAGFVWRPTSTSPDNVQCFSCNCQLDGWEEPDVPAFEHLTHSPSCGFAVVTCIRLRGGDPGRTEDDPASDGMVAARRDTFGDIWPLEDQAGYPKADQMAAAGWIFDPAADTPDGVTCPYCSLALDAWDAGDDPMEEHRRRSQDCLFFALTLLYNPPLTAAPAKKGKRASTTKTKRTSTRSSIASTASKKPTRRKKRASSATETSELSISEVLQPKRGRKRTSNATEASELSEVIQPKRGRKRASNATEASELSVVLPPKRGNKRTSNAVDETEFSEVVQPKRSKKRSSDVVEEPAFSEDLQPPPKRFRSSSFSSLPDDLPVGTPKKTPTHLAESGVGSFEMSSLPDCLLVGTPKKTPTRETGGVHDTHIWESTDMELFFASQGGVQSFLSDVIVDAGLDNIAAAGATPEDLYAAVIAGLTESEKTMTIEQWVLYNAKRGEEKLRMSCEKQIMAFEAEGKRALALLESIPTI